MYMQVRICVFIDPMHKLRKEIQIQVFDRNNNVSGQMQRNTTTAIIHVLAITRHPRNLTLSFL